ncbi:hypothetical protein Pogu_0620 [Pyrobaculum oguniense TE7]|uniref:Uncharacterized protein n=1 Tax=Pyrobaculum oguniense (strain DSM 13380 / JCM 10595 / TE7) TaxID=698757 RepID=H6Q7Z0_PYROT|nr:hypothetical protein Pogu_0620 [Pyrobaculum oguniense TE7]
MSDGSDICLRRPDMCGELWREEEKAAALREPDSVDFPDAEVPEALAPSPAAEIKPTLEAGVVVRHRGVLFSTYWELRNDAAAQPGDVVVVLPDRWLLMRRVKKPALWLEADERLFIPGRFNRGVCTYGYVPRGALEHVVQLARSGAIIAAMCDPRARVKTPKRVELQWIWRSEGYLVNLSPARIAVYHFDPYRGRRRFLADIAKGGCPIYSHWANQVLQALGVLARLIC